MSGKISWKEKAASLVDKHLELFEVHHIDDPEFIPKCAYIPKGKSEKYITFFPSELRKEKDIYTEFVSMQVEPEDPKRQLYKWKYNPFYDEEYEKIKNENSDDYRYLIPVKELIAINMPERVFPDFKAASTKTGSKVTTIATLPPEQEDAPLSDLTVRDLAAIMLKKPVSNKQWLNNLVKSK